mmetsp:Transcript_27963/g.61269  ORF Transcript_27963/g.61269 Transcript_27963/m.61269 type:complete len:241 (-) Transcript_27963:699-1421(-)
MRQRMSLCGPPSSLGREEHKLKVRRLPRVGDVHEPVRLALEQPVPDRRHVGRVIREAAVRFRHDERLLVLGAGREDHLGAARLGGDADLGQVGDHRRDVLVVERLANLLELHVEARVDLLELGAAHLADLLPCGTRGAVAALQPHDLLVRRLLERLVRVEDALGLAVELLQVVDRRWARAKVGEDRLQMRDQHAELRAPVAHVVDALHLVPAERQQTAERVADDGRTQVAHVHLLGHIGR